MSEPTTVEELREAQAKEYGTYVATEVIEIDGARAFNVGDPVPASHVSRGVVKNAQVEKKAAKTAAKTTRKTAAKKTTAKKTAAQNGPTPNTSTDTEKG